MRGEKQERKGPERGSAGRERTDRRQEPARPPRACPGGTPCSPSHADATPLPRTSSKSRHYRHRHPRNDGVPLGSERQTTKPKASEKTTVPVLPSCHLVGCKAATYVPEPNPKPCSGRAASRSYLWQRSAGGGAGRWWCWGLRAGWVAGCHSGWLHTSRSARCWARSSSACPWPGRWHLWPKMQRWTAAGWSPAGRS